MDNYVGRETLSNAMKLYFQRNSWKACEFEDFVSCIEEAAKDTPRGKNFRNWVDSWLLKAGANNLTSHWQQNEDQSWTLSVKQGYPRFGDQVLHEQVIDVAFYDENCQEKLIKDVFIRA